MRAVRNIYWNVLGWYHIGTGFDYWLNEIAKSRTREEIIADFFSIVISQNFGQLSNFQFTTALFNAYWPAGLAGNFDEFYRWLGRLESGEFRNNPVHERWGMVIAYLTEKGHIIRPA